MYQFESEAIRAIHTEWPRELTQINAIMPIKWVNQNGLISRILKSDLQLSGSESLLQKIPTAASSPAEA